MLNLLFGGAMPGFSKTDDRTIVVRVETGCPEPRSCRMTRSSSRATGGDLEDVAILPGHVVALEHARVVDQCGNLGLGADEAGGGYRTAMKAVTG